MAMKMDAQLVSTKEDYEVNYISYKFKIERDIILKAMYAKGRACHWRPEIYKRLREMGFTINVKEYKKKMPATKRDANPSPLD